MKRIRNRFLIAVGLLPLFALSLLVLLRPHEISQRTLRTGGRTILFMTDHVVAIAVIGAIIVVLLWGLILASIIWEGKSRD